MEENTQDEHPTLLVATNTTKQTMSQLAVTSEDGDTVQNRNANDAQANEDCKGCEFEGEIAHYSKFVVADSSIEVDSETKSNCE